MTLTACSSGWPPKGSRPDRPPYAPGGREEYRICFVTDPDGYRIELIDGSFPTPQDPPHPSQAPS
jgi:lactoylglutathione lyase